MEKLAEKKTKTGQEVNKLFDKITEEKIRSKTTAQAIAKTFKLDELIKGQRGQAPKPPPKRRRQARVIISEDGDIDYAPEVDPYEEMDVEGLLTLEDHVAPQTEKQIAKKPKLPEYQMDPNPLQIKPP